MDFVNRREIADRFKNLVMKKDTRSMDQICSSQVRGLLPQQKFIQEYTRTYPNWNKLLLYHEIGSGKTCTSILVAEDLINQNKKIKVILPARLKTNYIDELVSPCAMNKYISKEDALLYNDPKTRVEIKERIRRKFVDKIEQKYEIMSFDKLKLDITNKKLDTWIKEFTKDSLIIVDEVHNMVSDSSEAELNKVINENKIKRDVIIEDKNTLVLRLLVHYADPSCKFLFMTATPVFDNISQFKNLVLLLAENEDKDKVIQTNEVSQLTEFLRGKVSFFPGISENAYPKKEYVYHNIPISTMMKKERDDLYRGIKAGDIKESFLTKERQLLVFSPPSYDYKSNIKSILQNLNQHSPKMYEMLNELNKEGKHVIYSTYVDRGVNIVAALLNEMGWANLEDVIKNNSWDKYKFKIYCLWDGVTDNKMKQIIKNIMNGSDNKFGEKVRVVIGSPSMKEGVSFFQVQHLHLLDPVWNYSTKVQIEGRASRYCSHYLIDEVRDNPLLRKVSIHVYKIIDSSSKEPTADMKIYDLLIPKKYEFVKKAENALKKVAIDYYLFVNLYSEQYEELDEKEEKRERSPLNVDIQELGKKRGKKDKEKVREVKPCKQNEVYNPISHRCVKRDGKVGKEVLRRMREERKSPERKSRERKSPERKSRERKSPERKSRERKSPERKSRERKSPERKSRERKSPERKSRERKSPERKSREKRRRKPSTELLNTPCPDRNKIRNPETGICVNKDGRVGKEVLRKKKERERNNAERKSRER